MIWAIYLFEVDSRSTTKVICSQIWVIRRRKVLIMQYQYPAYPGHRSKFDRTWSQFIFRWRSPTFRKLSGDWSQNLNETESYLGSRGQPCNTSTRGGLQWPFCPSYWVTMNSTRPDHIVWTEESRSPRKWREGIHNYRFHQEWSFLFTFWLRSIHPFCKVLEPLLGTWI